jgi:hypothetical protein
VTQHDAASRLVPNPLNRYSTSPKSALRTDKDGSVDHSIEHKSPGKDRQWHGHFTSPLREHENR